MGMYDANDGRPGVVYILANEALREGIYKIGQSTRSGYARASELNAEGRTGMPSLYRCVYQVRVDDCGRAEKLVHQELYRDHVSKEFFRVDLARAKVLIERVCREVNGRPDLVVQDTDGRGKADLMRMMTVSNHRSSIAWCRRHMLVGAPISSAFMGVAAMILVGHEFAGWFGVVAFAVQEIGCALGIYQSSRVLREANTAPARS